MQALQLFGANDIRLVDVPMPELPKGGMIIKVAACSICGSDLRNIRAGGSGHGMTLPVTLGHEFSGTIYAIDDEVKGYEVGEKVVLSALITCGTCHYCKRGLQNQCTTKEALSYREPGAFAEYIALPARHVAAGGVIKLPDSIDLVEAAITEPCSCALNGQQISNVGFGDIVVVMGSGPLGLIHANLAKLRGAAKVILVDIADNRLELSKPFEFVDVRINSLKEDVVKRVMEETDGYGADVVMVASPAAIAHDQGVRMAAKRGRVNLFGGLPKGNTATTVDANIIHYKELSVQGTSDSTVAQMEDIVKLMADGRLNPGRFITHKFPLSQALEAFEVAYSGEALKVVIMPGV